MHPIRSVDIRATVTKSAAVVEAELDIIAPCFGGVRCGLGYSDGTSIRANGDTPEDPLYYTKFDETADPICSNGYYWMFILGTDSPNWVEWTTYHSVAAFDQKNRPPTEIWPTMVADFNTVIPYVIQKYKNNGYDGREKLYLQLANESGHEYVNDGRNYPALTYSPPYDGLTGGQWDRFADVGARNVIDQLNYYANNLSIPEGIKVIAPPLGCTPSRFNDELTSFYDDYYGIVDYTALNTYHTTTIMEAIDTHRWLNSAYDSIMDSVELIDYYLVLNGDTVRPVVLSEWGGNLSHLQLGVAPNIGWGFEKAGERLSLLEDKLMASGRFSWINFFCGWERDAGVADNATFALIDHNATTYNARFYAFLRKAGLALPEYDYRVTATETSVL